MDTQQIAYFLDIAETEHMTRSAERLHVAQPALSRSISRLEAEVGAKLFERKGRGIMLTEEGKILRESLSLASSEISRGLSRIHDSRKAATLTVRVRALAASLVVMDSIAKWMSENPGYRIELVRSPEAKVDVIIGPERIPTAITGNECTERIMLAAKGTTSDHPPIAPRKLRGMKFISLAAPLGFRGACDSACQMNNIEPEVSFESDNPEAVRKAVALGLGVGFWPEFSWGRPGDGVALIPIEAPGFTRSVHVSLMKESERARGFYDRIAGDIANVMSGKGWPALD